MIFRTGSVLIVGNCTIDILNIVYTYLKNILDAEYQEIYIEHIEKPKKQQKKETKKSNIS